MWIPQFDRNVGLTLALFNLGCHFPLARARRILRHVVRLSLGELLGVIRYRDLSTALFDPELGSLVRAADVTTPIGQALYPEDAVARACEIFSSSKDDCIPVVTREEPHRLLGVVRRRDVLRLLI